MTELTSTQLRTITGGQGQGYDPSLPSWLNPPPAGAPKWAAKMHMDMQQKMGPMVAPPHPYFGLPVAYQQRPQQAKLHRPGHWPTTPVAESVCRVTCVVHRYYRGTASCSTYKSQMTQS